jgi:hypothetical protein
MVCPVHVLNRTFGPYLAAINRILISVMGGNGMADPCALATPIDGPAVSLRNRC